LAEKGKGEACAPENTTARKKFHEKYCGRKASEIIEGKFVIPTPVVIWTLG
jgi:hypothetical protein